MKLLRNREILKTTMQTKARTTAKKEKPGLKAQIEKNPEDLIKEVKDSLENYKKGKYVKGDVKDIMKAIREYKDETD